MGGCNAVADPTSEGVSKISGCVISFLTGTMGGCNAVADPTSEGVSKISGFLLSISFDFVSLFVSSVDSFSVDFDTSFSEGVVLEEIPGFIKFFLNSLNVSETRDDFCFSSSFFSNVIKGFLSISTQRRSCRISSCSLRVFHRQYYLPVSYLHY